MRLLLPRRELLIQHRLAAVKGRVQIELGGEIVREVDNIFVNIGYQRIANYLGGRAPASPNFCAVGNGDGSAGGAAVTPAAADTALGFELLRKQVVSRGLIGVATARLSTQFSSTDVPRTLTEIGLFDTAGLQAQVTAATSTTLSDNTQNWTINQWAGWTVYLALGTGSGQKFTILSNTAQQLVITGPWAPTPDTTTTYVIGGGGPSQYLFARAAISPSLTKTQQPMNVIWTLALPQN